MKGPAVPGVHAGTPGPGCHAPQENQAAPRVKASLVPTITGVRISPPGDAASLVNISASGVLVECGRRHSPGNAVTLHFEGSFTPASIPGRVARTSVSGIGSDGTLRYQIAVAFISAITLPQHAPPGRETPLPVRPVTPAAPPQETLRNRW